MRPKMLEKLQQLPELRDVASDQQVGGLRAKLVFDRDTASRLGITPSAIDQTLYDAYGQRQVSTIFTQLNQYHVVLEVKPGFQKNPSGPARSVHPNRSAATRCPPGLVAGGSGRNSVYSDRRARQRAANASLSSHRHPPVRPPSPRAALSASTDRVDLGVFPNGGQVPLTAFTHVELTTAPITVNHQGQFPGGHALLQSGARTLHWAKPSRP